MTMAVDDDDKGANGPTMTTPSSKDSVSHNLNAMLLCLSLLGVGVICGYGAFYYMFEARCANILESWEVQFNTSLGDCQAKYEEVLTQHDEMKHPLHECQGRLEAQSILAERHQALLQEQRETASKVSALTRSETESSQTLELMRTQLHNVQGELDGVNQKLETTVKEKLELETTLRKELDAADRKLAKQEQDIRALKGEQGAHAKLQVELTHAEEILAEQMRQLKQNHDCESDLQKIKSYVQLRASKVCRMEYGKGPKLFDFKLLLPGDTEPSSFQVKLANLSEMPHAVFVFLELSNLRVYDGTTIAQADSRAITSGPAQDEERASKLQDRLRKFGYESPIALRESSPSLPHKKYTIGFVGDGPAFFINMEDNSAERGPEGRHDSVFGTVITGFDTLARVQEFAANHNGLTEGIEIVTIDKVKLPPSSSTSN